MPRAIAGDAKDIQIACFDSCEEKNAPEDRLGRAINATLAGLGGTARYDWAWHCHNWMRYQALVKGQAPACAEADPWR